jgi:hypothetical protein
MTTKPSIALGDLLEKGADTDLLREMIHHIVERVMQFDVENWTSPGLDGRSEPHLEALSKASGLTPPRWP